MDRITVVAPTEHLKVQWAEAAARAGIPIDPAYSAGQGKTSQDFLGVAVTYAGVAVNPLAHRIRTERFKTLVILDEVHHAGDALSWGEGVREAFDPATRRLALTGTPFRSDVNAIPFVTYEPVPAEPGVLRSVADYTYGYAQALADHVVRPVLFMAYSGEMQWRTRAGDEIAARLGEPLTKDLTAQALRTALDPAGSWMPAVLEAADRRLSEVRRHVADAAGLVIATDQDSARAYAKLLRKVSGEAPVVVLSDEKAASKKIAAFTDSDARWMVAVRMVSEGVDIPRLAVGVYATTTSTPLFFAQAIGRFVRARRRGETASVFVPSVPSLLGFASEMEVERDHVLGRRITDEDDIFAAEQGLIDRANASESGSDELDLSFEALGSQATFDRVLYDGGEFGHSGEVSVGSDEEMDFLGIPGLLERRSRTGRTLHPATPARTSTAARTTPTPTSNPTRTRPTRTKPSETRPERRGAEGGGTRLLRHRLHPRHRDPRRRLAVRHRSPRRGNRRAAPAEPSTERHRRERRPQPGRRRHRRRTRGRPGRRGQGRAESREPEPEAGGRRPRHPPPPAPASPPAPRSPRAARSSTSKPPPRKTRRSRTRRAVHRRHRRERRPQPGRRRHRRRTRAGPGRRGQGRGATPSRDETADEPEDSADEPDEDTASPGTSLRDIKAKYSGESTEPTEPDRRAEPSRQLRTRRRRRRRVCGRGRRGRGHRRGRGRGRGEKPKPAASGDAHQPRTDAEIGEGGSLFDL